MGWYRHCVPIHRSVKPIRSRKSNLRVLKAIEIGAEIYLSNKIYLNVTVMCDNMTATMYISNMNDIKSGSCNKIACNISDFYIRKKWISAPHIPETSNKVAD